MAGTRTGDGLLARAIAELQQLEPAGIGARSPVEALLLQLDPRDPDYVLLCRLLEDFLVDLSRNKRPQVADRLGVELDELERLLGVLGALEMRPGASLAHESAPVIHPDVMVHVDGDAFTVELSRGALPAVGIDPDAEDLLGRAELDADARRYLRTKVDKAREIVDAVELRGITLLRVAEATLRKQVEFLRDGPAALVPLSMTELAKELDPRGEHGQPHGRGQERADAVGHRPAAVVLPDLGGGGRRVRDGRAARAGEAARRARGPWQPALRRGDRGGAGARGKERRAAHGGEVPEGARDPELVPAEAVGATSRAGGRSPSRR